MLLARPGPVLALVFVFNGTACGDPPDPTNCSGFVGVRGQPAQLELLILGPDGVPAPAQDGARVPLVKAPQGGKHVFAGARVRNLDTCPIKLTAAIREPETQKVQFETRPVQFIDGGDGWAYARQPTQISDYGNVGLCPNQWASKDIYEQSYTLEVVVADRDQRAASRTITIVPYCSQPEFAAECMCECKLGYVLGQCTP